MFFENDLTLVRLGLGIEQRACLTDCDIIKQRIGIDPVEDFMGAFNAFVHGDHHVTLEMKPTAPDWRTPQAHFRRRRRKKLSVWKADFTTPDTDDDVKSSGV